MKKTLLILAGISIFQFGLSQNPLLIPDTIKGRNINLTLQNGTHQFLSGAITTTMGVNGDILAPTIILNKGDSVNFSVLNQLADTTTIHWHGLHVSPENDGGPHTYMTPSSTWNPSFKVLDKAATYWYHPHLHHKTNKHVSLGIAGLIIVRDSVESQLSLPRTYGIDDIPIVVQTKDFDASNQVVVHSNSDDIIMANATIDAEVDVPAQIIRVRLLNGSSQRAFNVGLTNNQNFYQIASDGGLLATPYQTTRLLLSPGERAEILIDFTGKNGDSVELKSFASELPNGIYGATTPGMMTAMTLNGYSPNPLNGTNFKILKFKIKPQNSSAITSIPISLETVTPWSTSSVNTTRSLTFSPAAMGINQLNGTFLINNVSFDMTTINYTIPLNNVEIWEITNQSAIAHPFHIHDVQFYILTRNGVAPPLNERGRKDVVLVKPQEVVRFITKFETFSNSNVPYMYHCHLLRHEDDGMMGQFIVSSPVSVDEIEDDFKVSIYPNPSNGEIKLFSEQKINNIKVFDVLGKEIRAEIIINDQFTLINNLPRGIVFVKIEFEGKIMTKKVLVN